MSGKRILVVDDEPSNVKIVDAILKSARHTVLTAADGEEGLKMIRAEKPDLVVLDLMLPKLDGWRVCQKVKQDPELQRIPIIMFSALLADSSEKEHLEMGDAYLGKPFDKAQLLAKVDALLRVQ